MTEQKLCKNCLYYKKDWIEHIIGVDSYDRCDNPEINGNLVTGKSKYCYCDRMRSQHGKCGPEAKYFEPK